MKVIIVGGVAAGAGTAARLRRLDETAEIVMIESGPYISWANCGLPYHLSGAIPEREALIITNPDKLNAWFNIDVRVNTTVTKLDRAAKVVMVRGSDGREYSENYDKLVLATGAAPLESTLPGGDDERIFHLRTIPDMDAILGRIKEDARRVVVVGAGFIGLEAAENLRERGLEVSIVELCDQVLPTLDKEMAVPLSESLASMGIAQFLERKVAAFESTPQELGVVLDDGTRLAADLVVMSIGVKPNNDLAAQAGLELGPRGHVLVNENMRTSDDDIYAAGDVVEIMDAVGKVKAAIPLAGPAARQARVVADNLAGRTSVYRGTYGTSIIKLGNLNAASVGLTERRLRDLGLEYEKVYVHPHSNAKYYPGGAMMHLKLLFNSEGTIYGAQVVGNKGVDKRVDTLSVAIYGGLTVHDLGELELAYAPPFNSARDPINLAGLLASNTLSGDTIVVHGDKLPKDAMLLDVREIPELSLGEIPGAINIPLSELRKRVGELDKSRRIVTICAIGQRGYFAERFLKLQGFDVANLVGGFVTWQHFQPHHFSQTALPACEPGAVPVAPPEAAAVVDVRAMACPGPVVRIKQEIDKLSKGETMQIIAALSFETDLNNWLKSSGNTLLDMKTTPDQIEALIQKGATMAKSIPVQQVQGLPANVNGHAVAMVMFSNDLDRALAGLILACGLAAGGAKVGIFFTLWGLSVLRRNPAPKVRKNLISRMFGMMLPKGVSQLKLSKMHMGGMGTMMMKQVMASKNVPKLEELIEQARALGVKFIACDMAMDVMGVTREELIEVDEVAGVASFAALAAESNNTLFI